MVILAKEERGVAVENARAMGRARGARRRREDIFGCVRIQLSVFSVEDFKL
jgi:hypothetical protein